MKKILFLLLLIIAAAVGARTQTPIEKSEVLMGQAQAGANATMTSPVPGASMPGQVDHGAQAVLPVPQQYLQGLPETKGVISWNLLGKVTTVKDKNRLVPQFEPAVTALDQTEVKVQGFMMPLDPGEKQKHFLLTAMPQTCAFCLPGGPESIVEVKTKAPIKYGFEPLLLSGKLAVLKSDPMGVYYRLTDAVAVK